MKKLFYWLLPTLFAVAAGCSGAVSAGLDDSLSFVPVARPLDAAAASVQAALGTQAVPSTSGDDDSFYIAVNKKELGQRWFMSAYLKQYFPGAVQAGAAISLGTRVVTFRVQNGKLFVFDASDNYKDSDTFDPTLIIDAYPIVSGYAPFDTQANASKFILVDPSAGMNRFGVLADAFAGDPNAATQFQIDVSYLQDFRSIADGSTWEQVFTGAATAPINDGTMSGNVFKASGTLGIAWRKYAESASYAVAQLPPDGLEHYFRSDAHLIPNSGQSYQTPIKWAIAPGMTPIHWLISDSVLTAQKNWPQYDIVGALKNAVTNWNAVFGYQVLDVDIAKPTDSYADDDKNYVLYDLDPSFGAAFANWRSNPNTGEIRGASIYFSDLWVQIADQEFADDVPGTPTMRTPQPTPQARAPQPMLSWAAMPWKPGCLMFAGDRLSQQILDVPAAGAVPTEVLTKKQKVERFLTHVLLHEVGHTLGLRHNFAGSLEPLSSSVMEYVLDQDTVHGLDKPGPYDVDAIKWLYGLSTNLPKQHFCTDEDTTVDPDCTPYDATDDPLNKYYGPQYTSVLGDFLSGANPTAPNTTLNNVLKYLRAGSAAQRLQAWQTAIAGLQVPADANKVATVPGYGARVDAAAHRLFARLYLDDASLRGDFTNDPAVDAQVTPLVLKELEGNLLDSDKIRSYDTRRAMVDILKKMQIQAAYDTLVDARNQINAGLGGLTGSDLNDAQDLLARIDAATQPYFN
jgi:hypothetical protein